MKTVLITGASGFLGHHLVKKLLREETTLVIAVLGRPEDKANFLPVGDRIAVLPCSKLNTTNFGHVDTLIHTAFARGENLLGLADSISMTEDVIELVNNQNIDSVINISTQGLYQGMKPGEKASEDGIVGPNTAYGVAKWAVEKMLRLGCVKHYTNIRMASLSANARFLDFFVNSVVEGKDITVTAPNQYASIMDVKDAVQGIMAVENLQISDRAYVYNLGPGEQHSILEYANMANQIGKDFGFSPIDVKVEDKGNEFAICMDCQKLMKQTGWKPEVSAEMMLRNMYKAKTSEIIKGISDD